MKVAVEQRRTRAVSEQRAGLAEPAAAARPGFPRLPRPPLCFMYILFAVPGMC